MEIIKMNNYDFNLISLYKIGFQSVVSYDDKSNILIQLPEITILNKYPTSNFNSKFHKSDKDRSDIKILSDLPEFNKFFKDFNNIIKKTSNDKSLAYFSNIKDDLVKLNLNMDGNNIKTKLLNSEGNKIEFDSMDDFLKNIKQGTTLKLIESPDRIWYYNKNYGLKFKIDVIKIISQQKKVEVDCDANFINSDSD